MYKLFLLSIFILNSFFNIYLISKKDISNQDIEFIDKIIDESTINLDKISNNNFITQLDAVETNFENSNSILTQNKSCSCSSSNICNTQSCNNFMPCSSIGGAFYYNGSTIETYGTGFIALLNNVYPNPGSTTITIILAKPLNSVITPIVFSNEITISNQPQLFGNTTNQQFIIKNIQPDTYYNFVAFTTT